MYLVLYYLLGIHWPNSANVLGNLCDARAPNMFDTPAGGYTCLILFTPDLPPPLRTFHSFRPAYFMHRNKYIPRLGTQSTLKVACIICLNAAASNIPIAVLHYTICLLPCRALPHFPGCASKQCVIPNTITEPGTFMICVILTRSPRSPTRRWRMMARS